MNSTTDPLTIPPEYLEIFTRSDKPQTLAEITPGGGIVRHPGMYLADLVGPRIARAVLKIVETGLGGEFPVRSPGPAWGARWYIIQAMPWFYNARTFPRGYLVCSRDVTDSQVGGIFRSLLETDAPFACLVTDATSQPGSICLYGGQAEHLFGFPCREVVGRPIKLLKHEDHISRVRQVTDNGAAFTGRLPYQTRRGAREFNCWVKKVGEFRVGLIWELLHAEAEQVVRSAAEVLSGFLGSACFEREVVEKVCVAHLDAVTVMGCANHRGGPLAGQVPPGKKAKRSTQRGEAEAKIIAALTAHHQYDNGSCLNPEPVGNNQLARMARVSQSSVSDFFTRQFHGYSTYRLYCKDVARLVASLKLLNDEFSPFHLYGGSPPIEGATDDE